jgi:alpha-beta hydrolase superfamily lysophospholipase
MEIIHENLEVHRRALGPEAPLGVLGHSMGGFIALNFLARYPEAAEFSWVSSPLIDPAAKASWLKRTMGLLVERIHPEYVLQSEVTSDQCKRDQAAIAATKADPLVHRQMTVRLGAELLSASRQLQVGVRSMRSDLKLLMTQGGEDTICPAVTSRRFFEQLPVTHKEYALFPELLHEPFNDIGKERFYIRLQSWLVDRLQKSWNAPPLPKAAA